jgi:hypothetical protein
MYNEQKSCPACHNPLIEIDRYGERLFGCIECNRCKWIGSNRPVMPFALSKSPAAGFQPFLRHLVLRFARARFAHIEWA